MEEDEVFGTIQIHAELLKKIECVLSTNCQRYPQLSSIHNGKF